MSLDPDDWPALRAQGHKMLDDMFDYVEHIRDRAVWQPIPDAVRGAFAAPVPHEPTALAEVHDDFLRLILPYATGNVHPGFMGWVHGGGTAVGLLAEMLAGGLNANCGGRDHVPIEVERQLVRWAAALFGFPGTASGIVLTGTSAANLYAVLIARHWALGPVVRDQGVGAAPLAAYSSAGAHGCIPQAMDVAGLGRDALRLVAVDASHRIDVAALEAAIAADRAAGKRPFLLFGTAGAVDTGAIDDLAALAAVAARERLWFHVDGAFGALAILAPALRHRLAGIERASSIAFDFHKWLQVPYDAGFLLVRDGARHRATFAAPAAYLRRDEGGLAGGAFWPCDYGLELSRGFRALKAWFTLRVFGTERLGRTIAHTCALAQHLKQLVERTPALELMAPVELNIVCFRYRGRDPDRLNAGIVVRLHESGIAAPSTTLIGGAVVIRAAIVNHRTEARDLAALVAATLAIGGELAAAPPI